MRISTQTFYLRSLTAMLQQQSALSNTQNQVATGRRVNSPADDPIAAVHILELQRAKAESDQYAQNSDIARGRLNLEEQSLNDVSSVIERVRELTVQAANTGTYTNADRQSIAIELANRLDELLDIANRKDGNGEFMFSGFASLTQPFARDVTGTVQYAGDQGARLVQVGPAQRVADGHSGADVFLNIAAGNGTFVTSAAAANTGTGVITVGSVTDQAAWVADNYTLSFTAPDAYQITDGLGNVVTTGAYTSSSAIQFNGIQLQISGTPATGDTFAVAPSIAEDVFATLQKIVTSLNTPAGSGPSNAQLASTLGNSLQQLDQITDHLLGVRAEVGARLSALDDADTSRDVLSVDLQASISELRDLDYAEALTRMNQQLVGLQAAQLSYTKISQLSLFNYLG